MVTKEDLRHELKELGMRFDAKLDRLEGKLMGEISRLEAKLMGEITEVRGEVTFGLTQVRGEITLMKWMLGVLLAGVFSLVLKAFFV
ncbi:MAG: hypothetical protein ACREYC_18910 [Gammaproteobacteria bacterium]